MEMDMGGNYEKRDTFADNDRKFRQPSTLMKQMLEDEEPTSPDLNVSVLRSKTILYKKSIKGQDGNLLHR